jgi:hypothetical protein
MAIGFGAAIGYAGLSTIWMPDLVTSVSMWAAASLAVMTAVGLLLLSGVDPSALKCFAAGVLASVVGQLAVVSVELTTARHFSSEYSSNVMRDYGRPVEEVLNSQVAWGTLGNPNDLGGFLLVGLAVFASATAYGLHFQGWLRVVGYGISAVVVWVGSTSLADARAFRLGVFTLILMHAFDRVLPPSRVKWRVGILLWVGGLAVAGLSTQGLALVGIDPSGIASDQLRIQLLGKGLSEVLASAGLGRGIGFEQVLIERGEIRTNFHNSLMLLAVELGLVVALFAGGYLLFLVMSWVLQSRSARCAGSEASVAAAAVAVVLFINSSSSSGVLLSPIFWAMLAATAVLARPESNLTGERSLRGQVKGVHWDGAHARTPSDGQAAGARWGVKSRTSPPVSPARPSPPVVLPG